MVLDDFTCYDFSKRKPLHNNLFTIDKEQKKYGEIKEKTAMMS